MGKKHRRTKNDKDSASLLRIHRTIQRKNTKFLRTKEKTRISSAFFALIQNFFLSLNVPLQTIGHAWAGIRGMPRFISGLEGHLRPETLNLTAWNHALGLLYFTFTITFTTKKKQNKNNNMNK